MQEHTFEIWNIRKVSLILKINVDSGAASSMVAPAGTCRIHLIVFYDMDVQAEPESIGHPAPVLSRFQTGTAYV